ncbi:transposase [Streptomyces sp. NPDC001595]|uniref:transposase n=1 Tax=Streptomyces sp. NPDC001532 TaxID=3154520 RepID=UPI003322ACFB
MCDCRRWRSSHDEIVNGILYVNRTGKPWEYLPHDFPPYETVYDYCAKWETDGRHPLAGPRAVTRQDPPGPTAAAQSPQLPVPTRKA